MKVEKAAAKFTASIGVRLEPGFPPMVPRVPEMEDISVIYFKKCKDRLPLQIWISEKQE